ncbi:MAG: hypothetical protein ACOY4Q_06700 [Bacillota bacterium]
MRKLITISVLIVLVITAGYKALPYLPDTIAQKFNHFLEKITGKEPRKTVLMFYEEVNKKEYAKASEFFALNSRKFYNPEYLKRIFDKSGRPEVTRSDEKGKTAAVYYQTENNQSLMANLIKEDGQWRIKDIYDDPSVTVD